MGGADITAGGDGAGAGDAAMDPSNKRPSSSSKRNRRTGAASGPQIAAHQREMADRMGPSPPPTPRHDRIL